MLKMDYKIKEPCEISDSAIIGEDTKIWAYTKILPRTIIGNGCIISSFVEIGPDVTIGNKCKIQNNVSVYRGVTLEEGVFCGPSCVFTNVLNPRALIEKKDQFGNTIVKKGASIGANSTIVCGKPESPRFVGKYSIVGAGSVVTKDVKDYAVVMGNPSKQTGWACICGEVISKELNQMENDKISCFKCSKEYIFLNNGLICYSE